MRMPQFVSVVRVLRKRSSLLPTTACSAMLRTRLMTWYQVSKGKSHSTK